MPATTENSDRPAEANSSALVDRSATDLARMVASGEVSAIELLEAHLARIVEVEPRLNTLAWKRFDEARRDARAIDVARAAGQPLGPLAGVPVSLKECFHLAGFPTTIGLSRLAETPLSFDGYLAQLLKRAGAVIVGKTNVPLAMLMHETDNPIFGRTNNPWALDRSPGGSSGGDAALIAAHGVPLGFSTDMAGSIRQPAHSCGIHGFKPSNGSTAHFGGAGNTRATAVIGAICGPMARTVDDIRLAARLLRVSPAELSEGITPDWSSLMMAPPVDLRGVRVAFWQDDGYFSPSPAIRRAVRESAEALSRSGIGVEEIDLPEIKEMARLYYSLFSADGAVELTRMVAGSKPDWRLERLLRLARMPRWTRRPMAAWASLRGWSRTADLLLATRPCSDEQFWVLAAQRKTVAREFFERMRARGFSAMLAPPYPLPALVHGASSQLTSATSHCLLANILECPAGAVAATRVLPGEETDRPASSDPSERMALKVEQGSAGLPVGVQVMAEPGQDELVLALMQLLEGHWKGTSNYPAAVRLP